MTKGGKRALYCLFDVTLLSTLPRFSKRFLPPIKSAFYRHSKALLSQSDLNQNLW